MCIASFQSTKHQARKFPRHSHSPGRAGRIDNDTLLHYLDEIFDCPGFQTKDQYVDCSDVTEYAVTIAGLTRFSNIIGASPAERSARTDRKIACVVPTDVEYGMGRIFLVQIENLPASYRLFRTQREAHDWLTS